MEQNLFTEGVRPGSVTTPEEVHMLICYIFREAGQPVTLDQANEVLQRQSLVNYFEFAEAAERLIRMGTCAPPKTAATPSPRRVRSWRIPSGRSCPPPCGSAPKEPWMMCLPCCAASRKIKFG